MAGKFSSPGLYENLSTNNTLNDANDNPGSTTTFLTSLPNCRKIVILQGFVGGAGKVDVAVESAVVVVGSGVFEGEGIGGMAGVRLLGVFERDNLPRLDGPSSKSGVSSSSTSVSTANSPAVRFPVAAIDRRLG